MKKQQTDRGAVSTSVRDEIVVFSPYNGEEIGRVAAGSSDDVAAAIARAHAAQGGWGATPLPDRLEVLRRTRNVLLRRSDELAQLIAHEQGKTVQEALLAEILAGLDYLSYCINESPRLLAEARRAHRLPFMVEKKARVTLRPRGVTSILSPWNYPFGIPFCQIVACLSVGNTVVMRPSTNTPLIALAFESVFKEAGLARDVLQVVTCRTDAADPLITDPRVRLVIFTGSTAVGKQIMAKASSTLCRTVLELGGKDALIVFDDANVERAARAAVWSSFLNCGQTCSSTERVYVQRGVLSAFTHRVVNLVRTLVTGDPRDPDTQMGPMTTRGGIDTVEAHVADAVARGARVLAGGVRGEGNFYPPTVLADVTHEMRVMREETFGPLLPIMAFDTEDEAVSLANDSEYGLCAAVFTRSRDVARRVTERLDVGTVTINDANFTFVEATAPWGGVKDSGTGRTHGPEGFADLVEVKYVSEDWSTRSRQLWWYPYEPEKLRLFGVALKGFFGPTLWFRVVNLALLVPCFPLIAQEANLPAILSAVPKSLTE